MNKKEFIELIHLYHLNELDEEERILVENKILEDEHLMKEFDKIKLIYEKINETKPKADEVLLQSARDELFGNLRSEQIELSPFQKLIEAIKELIGEYYKPAITGAFSLLIGILIGTAIMSNNEKIPMIENDKIVSLDEIQKSGLRVANVQVPETYTFGEEIEIQFEVVKPIRYKGKASEELTQSLLAAALTTSENPGIRLRAINTISQQDESIIIYDNKIKEALINTIKVDENAGVRKEALRLLMEFPFDKEIRDAILFVLSNDKNSGLRVDAINALTAMKIKGTPIDNEIINVLNQKSETDENGYVRVRAKSLLQGVN